MVEVKHGRRGQDKEQEGRASRGEKETRSVGGGRCRRGAVRTKGLEPVPPRQERRWSILAEAQREDSGEGIARKGRGERGREEETVI